MRPAKSLLLSVFAGSVSCALTCYAPPVGIAITNDDAVVPHATTSYGLGGSEASIVGSLWWTNQLNSNHGSIPATDPWQISGIGLSVGDNVITVSGEDDFGSLQWDSVTITRLGSPLSFYVATNGGNVYPYTNWGMAAHVIQDAVGVAGDDDTVWVSNGVYYITTEIQVTNGMTVAGVNGAGETIVDGQGTTRCFRVKHADAIVRGFTITNGCALGGGVGVTIRDGLVEDCLITGNVSVKTNGEGGGVYFNQGGTLRRCIVSGNTATELPHGSGGGLAFVLGGVAEDCQILHNSSQYEGGGVYMMSGGTLRNCLIADNLCQNYGGGLYVYYFPAQIENCTIVSNLCYGNGGGMYINGSITSRNTVIYYNKAGTGPNIVNWYQGHFFYCCTKSTTDLYGLTGCITNEPQFLDSIGGNWRLGYGSPCIDSGTDLSATVTNDLDQVARPIDGNSDTTADFDMGCFEYNPATYDTDGDTMADGYEHQYGLDPTDAADATNNPDGDAFNNLEEWIADTIPTNGESYFHLTDVRQTNSFAVEFACTNSRVYELQYNTNLVSGPWSAVSGQSNVVGDVAGTMSLTDSVDSLHRSYRVGVSIP